MCVCVCVCVCGWVCVCLCVCVHCEHVYQDELLSSLGSGGLEGVYVICSREDRQEGRGARFFSPSHADHGTRRARETWISLSPSNGKVLSRTHVYICTCVRLCFVWVCGCVGVWVCGSVGV